MIVLLLLLLIGVAAYFVWRSRTSSLTRQCRWRADRSVAADFYHCLACGGQIRTGDDRAPRACVACPPRESP